MFHPLSLIITTLVLLPNAVFAVKKPAEDNIPAPKEPLPLVVLERIGQPACFLIPLFFPVSLAGPIRIAALAGMVLALCVYYYCWVRYFRGKRKAYLLFTPLCSIPVPMAIFPVLYFLLSAVILGSIPMLISGLVLAAGHIPVSLIQYKARTGRPA
ncbi:MAG: hypothetical protein JW712_01775 [Dehalococcoidales bacterium]|nr:hypothetical protein [Dehalococcoidales bacterium]